MVGYDSYIPRAEDLRAKGDDVDNVSVKSLRKFYKKVKDDRPLVSGDYDSRFKSNSLSKAFESKGL